MFRLHVRLPQSGFTMVLFYWFELPSISEFRAALQMGIVWFGHFTTFRLFLHGIPDDYFAEDSFWSRSCLVLHVRDSVPNWSEWWIISCLVWFPWWLRHGAMDPLEGTMGDCRLTWFRNWHILIQEFVYVKGNNQPYFGSHNVDRSVEQLAAVPGFNLFMENAAERRGNFPFFNVAQETDRCHRFNTARQQDMLTGMVLFLLVILVRSTSCAPNSWRLDSCLMPNLGWSTTVL